MLARRYQLARIEAHNLKRFVYLALDFIGFDLLVGPNNSGKSTVLEACRLFDFCYRSCLRGSNGKLHFAQEVSLSADDFPVPGDLMHHHDVPAFDESDAPYWPPPIVLAGTLRRGDERHRYSFRLDLVGGSRFTLRPEPANPQPIAADLFGIILVPGFVGLLPQEERRTAAVLRARRTDGAYREIIRNLLLDLQRDEDRWRLLKNLVGEVFPDLALESVEFDEQVNQFIVAPYEEHQTGHKQPVRLDLFAAGSGFHQFVQVFTALIVENAPTVLLDEPDAHMFSRLQDQLYRALRRMEREGYQIIAATHAPNLIAAADPAQILSFTTDEPRRLASHDEVSDAARHLGAFDNLMLLLLQAHGRLIVVEGDDEKLLRGWLEALLPPADWRRVRGSLVFLRAGGRPSADKVRLVLDALDRVFSAPHKVRAYVVADRDYLLEEDLKKEAERTKKETPRQQWLVWQRVELENYLLCEEALLQVLKQKAAEADRPPPEEAEVQKQFWGAVEESRECALDGFMNQLQRVNKKWEPATCRQEAEKLLQKCWHGEARLSYCDAKQVLGKLRQSFHQRYGLSFKDEELIEAVVSAGAAKDLVAAVTELGKFLRT